MGNFSQLALLIFLYLPVAHAATSPIVVECKVSRFSFVNEHYRFKVSQKEQVFSRLFNQKQIVFKGFTAEKSNGDLIGFDTYKISFKDKHSLHRFAELDLPVVPKSPVMGGLEFGITSSIFDFAISSEDHPLYRLLLTKGTSQKVQAPPYVNALYANLKQKLPTFLSVYESLKAKEKRNYVRNQTDLSTAVDKALIPTSEIGKLPNDKMKKLAHSFNRQTTQYHRKNKK